MKMKRTKEIENIYNNQKSKAPNYIGNKKFTLNF